MAIVKGNKILTARQQKQQVLKWTGWTAKQYEKEYDKLRNRVRNYERANGLERGSIDAADLLAREARTRHYAPRYGEVPQSTTLYEAVIKTTSQSTGQRLTVSGRIKSQEAAILGIEKRYHGLLSKSEMVKQAVAGLKEFNPNYTAADLERVILETAHDSNFYSAARKEARDKLLKQGIITDKTPDTL